MAGDAAKAFYGDFLAEMKKQHQEEKIQDGLFGGYMQVWQMACCNFWSC
jgi:D-Tyr-tRNAtyr deacylase